MAESAEAYKTAYERERKIRMKAEALLEEKSRELFVKNQKLEESNRTLKQQQSYLVQTEKLATLGTLSAGVAHELNNPLAFVKSNISTLKIYGEAFERLIELGLEIANNPNTDAELKQKIKRSFDDDDLADTKDDIGDLLIDTLDGLSRMRDIIDNLSTFSRVQGTERVSASIGDCLESTLKLIRNQLNASINVKLNIQTLPDVICNPNELNQVFLNLIMNASHAVENTAQPAISINAYQEDDRVFITVTDNGCGMDEETQKNVFTPFYTTKDVGKGTGLGLSIALGIIEDHQGTIRVASKPGVGTKFKISLPIGETSE